MLARRIRLIWLGFTVLLGACRPDAPMVPRVLMSSRNMDFSEWPAPVWLGPVVNSAAQDWRPVLSTDGRKLYFHTNRAGGMGGFDIWVSQRAGVDCPWQSPTNLGSPLNTSLGDGDPAFTPDGHVIFYSSEGHGGAGRGDLFISRQTGQRDDDWEEPVNLGPDVNTAAHESNPAYVEAEEGGTLYFVRSAGNVPANSDIYKVRVSRDGQTFGPAVLVDELSEPAPIGDQAMTVRADGRELIFWSGGAAGTRPGSVGLADMWVSTRQSPHGPWSAPENLGAPLNSRFADLSAQFSHDGRTLFLTLGQERGGLGLQDMWMTTVEPNNDDAQSEGAQCSS